MYVCKTDDNAFRYMYRTDIGLDLYKEREMKTEDTKRITVIECRHLKVVFTYIIKQRNKPAGMMASYVAQGRRAHKHWKRARRRANCISYART